MKRLLLLALLILTPAQASAQSGSCLVAAMRPPDYKIKITTTSAGNVGCTVLGFYTEIQDTMSSSIIVDGASNVRIDGHTAAVPSGRMRSAVRILNSASGNFNFSPSNLSVSNLYAPDLADTLLEDLQAGTVFRVGADPNNPYRGIISYSSPKSVGTGSTNGYRNFGQIIGTQQAKLGPDIASAGTIVPHPDGSIFRLTGTTTSTDVTFTDYFIGKIVTFVTSAAVQITSGNHWKLTGNFVANGTGNDDTLTGFVDANKDFRQIAVAIP